MQEAQKELSKYKVLVLVDAHRPVAMFGYQGGPASELLSLVGCTDSIHGLRLMLLALVRNNPSTSKQFDVLGRWLPRIRIMAVCTEASLYGLAGARQARRTTSFGRSTPPLTSQVPCQ